MLPDSFHWIIRDKLAGAEKPTVEQLQVYSEMGFNSIVSLQENIVKQPLWERLLDYDLPSYTLDDLRSLDFDFLHIPIPDMTPPSFEQMDAFVNYVNEPGRVVLVHCYGGIGRTGCMVAAYYGLFYNICGRETLNRIRSIWRPYIQTYPQEDAVVAYIDSKLGCHS